ncbi:MAG: MerR family transcriptional regulator [Candidatus Dependentiae bacterium]
MRMQKRQFRIGTLAEELGLEKFVIRFWEKEFNIKSSRSVGGQRYYTTNDVTTFKKIKELLYTKKFTIAGAKKALEGGPTKVFASKKTTMDPCDSMHINKKQLLSFRKKLLKLKEYL